VKTTAPHTSVAASDLQLFGHAVLTRCGVSEGDASLVISSLLSASLRGVDTHGIVTLLPIYAKRLRKGLINPSADIRMVGGRGAVGIMDGDNGLGALVATQAVTEAVHRAREHATSWVGVRNSNHFGAAGYYTMMAAEQGYVGVAITNGPPNMAPWGAAEAYLSTNPISIAVPAPEGPIVLDMATSVVARLQVVQAAARGDDRIPEGWALDEDGRPTTDPKAAADGFIMPLGAHKGYGLSLMIDLLAGAMTGAAFGRHVGSLRRRFDRPQHVGHLFSVVDVSAFGPPEDFAERVTTIREEIRALPKAAGVDHVYLPGEIEEERHRSRERDGIPMSTKSLQEFDQLAEQLDLPSGLRISA
jgi:LDH2 family malate/lactate/ureidoglycolate dehydrogenase